MINKIKILLDDPFDKKQVLIVVYGIVLILFFNLPLEAQIRVSKSRDLSFGSFLTGVSGGTVIQAASTSSTGSVFLIDTDPGHTAIFGLKADGIVTLTTQVTEQLNNGSGGSMTLVLDRFYPSFPLTLYGVRYCQVGGTLIVGPTSTTPAGIYTGSFELTFNYQ